MLEPLPDPDDSVIVFPEALVQTAGAVDLFDGSFRRPPKLLRRLPSFWWNGRDCPNPQ